MQFELYITGEIPVSILSLVALNKIQFRFNCVKRGIEKIHDHHHYNFIFLKICNEMGIEKNNNKTSKINKNERILKCS